MTDPQTVLNGMVRTAAEEILDRTLMLAFRALTDRDGALDELAEIIGSVVERARNPMILVSREEFLKAKEHYLAASSGSRQVAVTNPDGTVELVLGHGVEPDPEGQKMMIESLDLMADPPPPETDKPVSPEEVLPVSVKELSDGWEVTVRYDSIVMSFIRGTKDNAWNEGMEAYRILRDLVNDPRILPDPDDLALGIPEPEVTRYPQTGPPRRIIDDPPTLEF